MNWLAILSQVMVFLDFDLSVIHLLQSLNHRVLHFGNVLFHSLSITFVIIMICLGKDVVHSATQFYDQWKSEDTFRA